MVMRQRASLSRIDIFILVLVTVIILTGFVLFYTNMDLFMQYTVEDGLVEWLTVIGLLLGTAICIYRFVKLRRKRNLIFLLLTLLVGILLFAVAGEEVSWGQRIFGIRSSEFFQKNNTQSETNFHNMVVDGVKINKLIFTFGLIAALGIFLIVLPIVYRRNEKIRHWADNWGILIPRSYQIIAFVLLFAVTASMRHEKNSELLECGASLLFFLIVRNPLNKEIFKH